MFVPVTVAMAASVSGESALYRGADPTAATEEKGGTYSSPPPPSIKRYKTIIIVVTLKPRREPTAKARTEAEKKARICGFLFLWAL